MRELAKRGFPQRLVARRGSPLPQRCADIIGLEIREVSANPFAAGLATRGASVAHSHEGRTVYSGLLGEILFDVPYVVTRRVVAPQSAKFVRRWAYGSAGRLVAISEPVVASIRQRFHSVDIDVVADAVAGLQSDKAEVAAIRARHKGKVIVGHVGALANSHKGQSTIIDAARMAAEQYPDWHFLICGDGEDRQRYEQEIGDLENIELLGFVDNVGDYLASFDVFVYPSLHEALGSALLDAMQFGLPIVASNVDGIPDVVEDGVNGVLIEPQNAEQLLDAVARLATDSADVSEIKANNIKKAGEYGVERMADAYQAIYEQIST